VATAILAALTGGMPLCLAQAPPSLSRKDAEALALKSHPLIQSSQLNALAARQMVTETKAARYPFAYGSLTGAGALSDSRIAAGGLNNPIIYDRYSNGLTVSQLLTDFGRTHNLVESSNLHAQAQAENAQATRADVLIEVDRTYYQALRAQALLKVAEETVGERQLVSDQVGELAKSRLKSGLDVSFANVNLAEAKLMLVQAQNDVTAAFAQLSAAVGDPETRVYALADEPMPGAPSADVSALIAQAMQNRPELAGLRYDSASAHRFATAERDLSLPTISAAATAGFTPVHQAPLTDRYAAAGVNVTIPIFNGRLFSARAAEARLRAEAADQNLRQEADAVARDVHVAWLNAQTTWQRLALTQQLLDHASLALDLAQQRYKLGIGSIVELSQAQLNQTQAQIEQSGARYDYQASIANLDYQVGVRH
jgi:outer membrane protein